MIKAAFVGLFFMLNGEGVPVDAITFPFDNILDCASQLSEAQKAFNVEKYKNPIYTEYAIVGVCLDSKDIK